MKLKAEYNVPQLISHDITMNIQQVGLGYGLFSKIVKIKRELVVVVEKSSKAKPKEN